MPRPKKDYLIALAFLLPNVLGFLLFTAGPSVASLGMSVFRWDLFSEPRFVDLDHYAEILFGESGFWHYLGNTAFFAMSVPLSLLLGLGFALILNRSTRGFTFLKSLYFLPVISSGIAIAIIWQWLLNKDFGIINSLLMHLGSSPIDWLGTPWTAKGSIVLLTIWKTLGYNILIYLAALQGIPAAFYEAAGLDGASRFHRFYHITLPLLGPAHLFLFVTGFIATFQLFGPIYVMTEGGPLKGTWSLVYEIWWVAFREFRMGYAAAFSWILFALIFIATAMQWRIGDKRVHYS